jgi:Tfp pilus assembly protein PilO
MIAALRNKRFLVFGGAAALCLLFLGGSVIVHLKQYYALHMRQVAANQQLSELQKAVSGIETDKLQQENQELAAELSEIERSLPEREYVPTLLRQIESGAAMTHNDLVELRQGEIRKGLVAAVGGAAGTEGADQQAGAQGAAGTNPPGGAAAGGAAAGGAAAGAAAATFASGQRYSEMDIEVRLDGSYVGAFEFMRHLGKIGKIIAVETIEIEKSGTHEKRADGVAVAGIQLDCKAYILEPRSGFPGQVTIRIF